MKWAFQVKDKMKVAGLLMAIIIVIALGHISGRQNYSDLGNSISSIYEDRLLPATYIYQINEHMYQKRLLDETEGLTPAALAKEHRAHDLAIAKLIKNYETTFLTIEEKEQWKLFKTNLHQYLLSYHQTTDKDRDYYFAETLHGLHQLSNIQVGEGGHLKSNSKAIINGTIVASYLEICLLLVLGIITVVLLSATDRRIFKQVGSHPMN